MLDKERIRGAGVLMSTHALDTAERICDSFLLISGGKLVAKGTFEQIRSQCEMPHASLFDCYHCISLPRGV